MTEICFLWLFLLLRKETLSVSVAFSPLINPVECVYWTEPKATYRQCKIQPNAYNMYIDLERILSVCLYLHVSFYPGMVNFCRYIFYIFHRLPTYLIYL
jgi:hypothetical protein